MLIADAKISEFVTETVQNRILLLVALKWAAVLPMLLLTKLFSHLLPAKLQILWYLHKSNIPAIPEKIRHNHPRATAFTFKEEIKNIQEPRRTRYGNIRHKLEDIIIIGLCTIICGGEDFADMEAFGKSRQEIDLKNPKTNRKNAGFTDEERACFGKVLESGFIDTFRYFYPDVEGRYSWWSYRFKAREKNAGWRIDYFITSPQLKDKLEGAEIHSEIMGSDHCPVELQITL